MKKLILLFLLTLTLSIVTKAQTYPVDTTGLDIIPWQCGNDSTMFVLRDTALAGQMSRYNNSITSNMSVSYVIPVVVHIITPPSYSATINYSQIKWAIASLNAQFQDQISNFTGHSPGPRAVNTNIEFRLACTPMPTSGTNPTTGAAAGWTSATEPGVIRYTNITNSQILNQPVVGPTSTAATYTPMISMTNPTGFFPQSDYLNIYVVPNIFNGSSPGTVLGFATLPWWTISSGGLTMDGIVIRLDALGNNSYPTNFPLNPNWNLGYTLAHEAGHYLGLYHTFQPSIANNFNYGIGCYGTTSSSGPTDGDCILDTPPSRINFDLGSLTTINTCNENNYPYGGTVADQPDQLENNMCYSIDPKRNTFTTGQATRMVGAFTSARANLVSSSNLTATGVNSWPTSCAAYTGITTGVFNYNIGTGSSCTSVVIQFTNPTSLGFNVSSTTYSWTFGDGGTAAIPSPTHTYVTTSTNTFVATCTATSGTVVSTYSTVVSASFNVNIIGQDAQFGANTVGTVCQGTEQTMYLQFGAGVPSVNITPDGTTQITVYNYLDQTQPEIVPYMFTANSSVSYSIMPIACGSGTATFNVINCCSTLISNGDFESTTPPPTGFNTDLAYCTNYTSGNLSNPPLSYGYYAIDVMSQVAQFHSLASHIATTGKVMCVDGFAYSNGIVNIPPVCSSTLTPRIWQQVVTGLQPNTPYYFAYKIFQNIPQNGGVCPSGVILQSNIKSSTYTALSPQTFTPTLGAMVTPTSTAQITCGYDVASYTFTTSGTVSPTDNFSVTISQFYNFEAGGFDYSLDNITLQALTPGIQAIGNATVCAGTSTPISAIANCGASLSGYTYTWLPSTSVACYTCTSTSATPSATTVYTLVATSTSTVIPAPPAIISTITVTANSINITPTATAICIGQSATLTATTATSTATYTWSPGTTLSCTNCASPVASPTTTTTYTVNGITSGGCVMTNTFTLAVGTITPTITVVSTPSVLCTGQVYTLTASGASSYSWNTGGTTPTITVSTGSVGAQSYSVTGTTTGCSSPTKTLSLYVNASPTLSVSPLLICYGAPTTLTASGATNYTWYPSTPLSCSTCPNPTATLYGGINLYVTGTYTTGCSTTRPFLINVTMPSISVTATPTVICVNQSSTLTASGGSTYTWSPAGSLSSSTGTTVTATPTATTIYTVNGTDSYSCAETVTVNLTVSNCTVCPTCTTTLTGTITTSPASGGSYCINNNITIASTGGTITFLNSEFKIAPGVVITLAANAHLSIQNCHLYACSGMWQGIVVPSSGVLGTSLTTLIEDAKVAITTTTTTQGQMAGITLNSTVFNKNNVSVQVVSSNTINPGSGSTYPITIAACVFTGRTINTTTSTTMPNWPSYSTISSYSTMPSPLQAPYLNSYSITTCKDGTYPLHAIELTNVGTTTWNPSSPPATYDEVYLGGNSMNIFDNHYYDIYANNTNLTVVNSVFQNAQFAPGHHGVQALTGEAVYAYSTDNAGDNYRLQLIPATGTVSANSFYNLYTLVDMYHYLETNIKYNNCYSTMATYTVSPPNGVWQGETGFTLWTNRYYNLTVDHNNIYNISNSILFTADAGNYTNLSGGVSSGRYGGQVNITNNLIRPHLLGTTPTTQFVNQGINVSDILSLGTYTTNLIVANTNIYINNNIISKVWNGIYASGFGLQPVSTYSNYVTLVKAQNGLSSPTQQYGISHNSVTSNTISVNYVDASAINASEQSRNITTALNGTISITCNTETGGWRGIEFNGTQTVGSVGNQFSNNTYGMVLDNSGVIGVQGTSTNPRWLEWTGTWGSSPTISPFKTATFGSGSSAVNSILWVKGSPAVYTPDGNGYTDYIPGTTNYYNSGFTGTLRYSSSPASWSCSTTVPTCTNCRGAQPVMSTEDSVNAFNAMQLMEKVAANAIQYDAADSAINRYMSKMTVYRRLRADTNAFFGSQKLRAFYQRMQNSSMEKLFQTEDAFVNGDFATAQNSAASVNPANKIEQNHLTYYGILINQKKNAMTTTDSSNLWILANACPFIDGAIVYQARALYNAINSPGIIFRDNCKKINAANRLANTSNANSTNTIDGFDAYVYPNPNSGKEVFVNTLGLNEGTVVIKLMDLEGRTVVENNCSVSNGVCNFKINDIKNGVYFVHITNTSTGEHIVKKIVIQY
jgi:hypothetical protein